MTANKTDLAQAEAEPGVDQAAALRATIEREFPDLRRGVEALVWRLDRTRQREAVAALAEEVLQDTVVRALSRAEAYDPARSAHAWLLGIATNVLREHWRRSRREASHVVHRSDVPSQAESAATSDAALARTYDLATGHQDRLVELLDLVSPSDRAVLTYAFVDDLRGPELAAALGIKDGAARVRLSRAVSRLAAAYQRAEQPSDEER